MDQVANPIIYRLVPSPSRFETGNEATAPLTSFLQAFFKFFPRSRIGLRFHFSVTSLVLDSIEKIYQTIKTWLKHISKHLRRSSKIFGRGSYFQLSWVLGKLLEHGLSCLINYTAHRLPWKGCVSQLSASSSDLFSACSFSSSATPSFRLRSFFLPFRERFVFAGVEVTIALTEDGNSVVINKHIASI